MSTLFLIIISGILMSCIALVGCLTLFLSHGTWEKWSLRLVAFAAGSLLGAAIFHMIPAAVKKMGNVSALYCWFMGGFMLFYALEEFLSYHHSHTHIHTCSPLSPPHQHNPPAEQNCSHVCDLTTAPETPEGKEASNVIDERQDVEDDPTATTSSRSRNREEALQRIDEKSRKQALSYLILIADGVHNLLGGMFVGASFVDSPELGWSAWLAAAAHEVPQELGDFAVLVHGGWSKPKALLMNFLSALTFLVGGIIAYAASKSINTSFLIPFAAGNFVYIAGSDLIPEVKHLQDPKKNFIHFVSFSVGVGLMLSIRIGINGW